MNNSILKHLVSILLFLCTIILLESILDKALAQTPGMIIKPAQIPGNIVLDPNLDGYVSQLTNGVQLGFTIPPDNDVAQSEIPYVPIVRPDPTGDILRGPVGGFIEIVGTDAAGNNAIMVYNDGTNLLFRFRLGDYAPNSKSYSIMIDTDQKFGFTGANADPNAVSGNPGFEIEVVMETNFSVNVYNVDGTVNGTLSASHSFDTNGQISMAVSTAGGDPDYFYDFYVPLADLSALGVTPSTPLRFVAVTVMNPHPAIGNNALSDIGGVTSGSNIDEIFTDLIDSQTPTTTGNINNGGVTDRSACPTIDAVSVLNTSITGTSTEASGTTINASVYKSDGTTLIGSGTTTTSGSAWTINVSALSPAVALAKDQIIKATATAVGKGTSIDNCSLQTVTNCSSNTGTNVTITPINGGKGYTITNTFAAGTIFTWYNADFTLANYVTKSGGSTYIQNPQTSATSGQTISFSTETGQTFPSGVFYFTFQEPGKCISSYVANCAYSASGTSVAPVITSSVITSTTSTISGTCGSSSSTLINLYANGIFLKSISVVNSTTWTISGLDLKNYDCAVITATAADAGKCPTASLSGVPVSHVATKPTITTNGCSASLPVTSISGNTSEADGSVITLYKTNTIRTAIGTATVSGGTWTVSSLSLNSGDKVVAAITSGSCVSAGPDSDPITISSQTNISNYSITIATPIEGQSSINGTISGGIYPVTLQTYIDGTPVGSAVTVNSAGNWTVSGLLSTDLYVGGTVNVTLTGSGCESDFSTASAIVQCIQPLAPTYSGGNYAYCYGNAGSINVTGSQLGIVYQLVDNTGTIVGPSAIGNGGTLTLYTNALTSDLSNIYVKAYKVGNSSCSTTSSTIVNFTPQLPSPTITFSTTSLSVQQGTTIVNLPYTAKSTSPSADKYTVTYSIAAKAQGFSDVTSPVSISSAPANISLSVPAGAAIGTYTGTIAVSATSGSTCTSYYSFSIVVYGSNTPPVISVQPMKSTICGGNTASLSTTAYGAGTLSYQWQSASSYSGTFFNVTGGTGATSASYTTAGLSSTTYYQVIISNAYGSTTSNVVEITVNSKPTATGSISGNSSICAGKTETYTITSISDASSYSWSYSGTNVSITNNDNSANLNFGANATSGTLSVSGNNDCGSGNSLSIFISVNSTPNISDISASTCSGSVFSVTPVNGLNGLVPSETNYSWTAPVVTGLMTGGASGSGTSITGNLINTTNSTQTATYTVTPTKGTCTGNSFTVVISVNPQVNVTVSSSDVLCNGASTGSISTSVTRGTPVYTYDWTGSGSFSSTSQNLSGLAAGTYNLTVTDSKGCKGTASVTINQPSAMTITPAITSATCNGNSNGAITIAVSGGAGSYTYLWNDGVALQNRTALSAGTYSVTVTDNNGCKQTSSGLSVTQPTAISVTAFASSILCNGGSSTITVTASGGTGTLQYSLNGGTYQDGNTFSGIAASSSPYIITVKDGNGCTNTTSVTVSQPAAIGLSSSITQETCPGLGDGAIILTVSGGTLPYTYLWNDANTSKDRSSLSAGSYTVTVKDVNNCSAGTSATVTTANPSPVTPGTITK